MTSYARLQRAAATLKRVRAGLDSLAAGASSEEERERLRRAAVQARVMYEGLERRLRRALEHETRALEQEARALEQEALASEQEAQHAARAPAAEGSGPTGTAGGTVAGSAPGERGEPDARAAGGARPAAASDGGPGRAGAAVAGPRPASRRRRSGGVTTPRGGQSGAR
ncbi:MAG TPA: translation initiation factor IF-2 [Thermaerobacter sp.]